MQLRTSVRLLVRGDRSQSIHTSLPFHCQPSSHTSRLTFPILSQAQSLLTTYQPACISHLDSESVLRSLPRIVRSLSSRHFDLQLHPRSPRIYKVGGKGCASAFITASIISLSVQIVPRFQLHPAPRRGTSSLTAANIRSQLSTQDRPTSIDRGSAIPTFHIAYLHTRLSTAPWQWSLEYRLQSHACWQQHGLIAYYHVTFPANCSTVDRNSSRCTTLTVVWCLRQTAV